MLIVLSVYIDIDPYCHRVESAVIRTDTPAVLYKQALYNRVP